MAVGDYVIGDYIVIIDVYTIVVNFDFDDRIDNFIDEIIIDVIVNLTGVDQLLMGYIAIIMSVCSLCTIVINNSPVREAE